MQSQANLRQRIFTEEFTIVMMMALLNLLSTQQIDEAITPVVAHYNAMQVEQVGDRSNNVYLTADENN